MSATSTAASVSVVLVHGGFVDGSGWQGVYNILQQHGYRVSIVQNPTISLDDDVAVTKRVIAAQRGPVVLVGHPYWAWLSRRPATIRRLLGSFASRHLRRTRANRSPLSSQIRHPVRPCLQFFLRRTGSSCLTERSSPHRSRQTFQRTKLSSWRIPRFRGASTH